MSRFGVITRNGIVRSFIEGSQAIIYDPDAQAFFTAANITNTTQKSAVNQLVLDLKSANIWTKMKALYPVVGGVASSHAVNLKQPGTFNLSFATGWTHSSTGMTPNGATYANTFFNPVTQNIGSSSAHMAYYGRTPSTTSDGAEMGNYNGVTVSGIAIQGKSSASESRYYYSYSLRAVNSVVTAPIGLVLGTSTSTASRKLIVNNIIKGVNNTTDTVAMNNFNIYIGAANLNNTTVGSYVNCQLAFSSIGDGLTDAEATNFYNAVQNYQTTLNRQVP